MAGTGKSTLLTHLSWWWQRTGLIGEFFKFSFEERAWTASQIIRDISTRLLDRTEQARADTMPEIAQLEQIAERLRAARHLIILDNAESITASPAAIPHALSTTEQGELRTFLTRLRGGKTLVIVGSREKEAWLAPGTFEGNAYRLAGLDSQAASTLVDRILERHGATHWLHDDSEREAVTELTTLLGGYPLPMAVVLSSLATVAPSEVLASLRVGDDSADPAGLIANVIEYSHGRLDPSLQAALLLLAPFVKVIPPGPFLDQYKSLLMADKRFNGIAAANLEAAVDEIVRVGLAVAISDSDSQQTKYGVRMLPILPYFLRSRLRQQDDLREALDEAHYQLYTTVVGPVLFEMQKARDKSGVHKATEYLVRAEYANLTAALNHGLETGQLVLPLIYSLGQFLEVTQQHSARRKMLDDAIARYPRPLDLERTRELIGLHQEAAHAAFDMHYYEDAKSHLQTELRLMQDIDERKEQAIPYRVLGEVAFEQRQFDEAKDALQKALDIKLEFADQSGAAGVWHELGMLAQEQGQFDEARDLYRKALEIRLEFKDRHAAAMTYNQLGMIARKQGKFDEAKAAFQRSLDIKLELGNRHETQSTLLNLGGLASDQHRFAEAEIFMRQALEVNLEFNDRHGAAQVYHDIGWNAQQQGRYSEAEANYLRCIDIFGEFGDRYKTARPYLHLGMVALLQGMRDEAEAHSRKALELCLEFTDEQGASLAFGNLGAVFQGRQQFAEAEAFYLEAIKRCRETDIQRAWRLMVMTGNLRAFGQRHSDAVAIWLDAAVIWFQNAGTWNADNLRALKREREAVGQKIFASLVKDNVPADIQRSLIKAVDAIRP